MAIEQPTAKPTGTQSFNSATNSEAHTVPQGDKLANASSTEPRADDLIRRMGQAESQTTNEPSTASPAVDPSDIGYSQSEIDSIKDPVAKKLIEEKLKLLEKGYNQKYMKLANERKQAEELRKQLEAQTNQSWTPERVQQLMRDPNFVQSAQALQATQAPQTFEGTQDEWSALSTSEKRTITEAKNEAIQTRQQLNRMMISMEEVKIKEKFPDYEGTSVEKFYRDAAEGRIPEGQIRELIHKAQKFDQYLERAYKFGLEDRNQMLREKANGISQQGITTQTIAETPKPAEGERGRNFFARLAKGRLQNS